jgi:3-methylfumaryl-CoA hydratase
MPTSPVGRTATISDSITGGPAERLTAVLDYDDARFAVGDALPDAWHWLYFHVANRASTIGPDGRGAAGDLLPPLSGQGRMWAGGSFTFHAPLRVGMAAERRSEVASMVTKDGRSGPLQVATVDHRVTSGGELLIEERTDIVFRALTPYAAPAVGERAKVTAEFERRLLPDEVLLFSFSALTWNPHRIHFDLPYVTGVEGYPGLLVHGPLTAILLLDLVRRNSPGRLATFSYRAQRALFCGQSVRLAGRRDGNSVTVWAEAPDGSIAMRGSGEYA